MKKVFKYEIHPVEKIIYKKGEGVEIQIPIRGKNYKGRHYYWAEEDLSKDYIKYKYMGTDINFEVKL